jgi:hypothetical protein
MFASLKTSPLAGYIQADRWGVTELIVHDKIHSKILPALFRKGRKVNLGKKMTPSASNV